METARIDFESLQRDLATAIGGMQETARAVNRLNATLFSAQKASSVGEQWAQTWGETLNKKDAAKMLGISTTHLYDLINEDAIRLAPDGRVLTRSAAEWANSAPSRRAARNKQRWHV